MCLFQNSHFLKPFSKMRDCLHTLALKNSGHKSSSTCFSKRISLKFSRKNKLIAWAMSLFQHHLKTSLLHPQLKISQTTDFFHLLQVSKAWIWAFTTTTHLQHYPAIFPHLQYCHLHWHYHFPDPHPFLQPCLLRQSDLHHHCQASRNHCNPTDQASLRVSSTIKMKTNNCWSPFWYQLDQITFNRNLQDNLLSNPSSQYRNLQNQYKADQWLFNRNWL